MLSSTRWRTHAALRLDAPCVCTPLLTTQSRPSYNAFVMSAAILISTPTPIDTMVFAFAVVCFVAHQILSPLQLLETMQ